METREEFEERLNKFNYSFKEEEIKTFNLFLEGMNDLEIAKELLSTRSNISRRISKICKHFGFENQPGEHFTHKPELVAKFIKFKPELVSDKRCQWLMDVAPELTQKVMLGKLSNTGIFDYPGSPLPVDSNLYISDPIILKNCISELKNSGGLIRIKGAVKTGKSSLLNQIIFQLKPSDYKFAIVDFRRADSQVFTDYDRFLKWFCISVCKQIGITPNFEEWSSEISSNVSCSEFFEDNLLLEEDKPIVLVLENIEQIFFYPDITKDFLAMLRGWYEDRNNKPDIWGKLFRQIVIYGTDLYVKVGITQSPFNVGLGQDTPALTTDQVLILTQRYRLQWSNSEAHQLTTFVGGHPYLIQFGLYHIHKGTTTLSEILETGGTQAGLYGSYLSNILDILESQPELVSDFQSVLQSPKPYQLSQASTFKLEGLGVVTLEGNAVQVSCPLYQEYFSANLAQQPNLG